MTANWRRAGAGKGRETHRFLLGAATITSSDRRGRHYQTWLSVHLQADLLAAGRFITAFPSSVGLGIELASAEEFFGRHGVSFSFGALDNVGARRHRRRYLQAAAHVCLDHRGLGHAPSAHRHDLDVVVGARGHGATGAEERMERDAIVASVCMFDAARRNAMR